MEKKAEEAISQQTKDLIGKLLLGRFSVAEIAKITDISEEWIQNHINSLYEFAL